MFAPFTAYVTMCIIVINNIINNQINNLVSIVF